MYSDVEASPITLPFEGSQPAGHTLYHEKGDEELPLSPFVFMAFLTDVGISTPQYSHSLPLSPRAPHEGHVAFAMNH